MEETRTICQGINSGGLGVRLEGRDGGWGLKGLDLGVSMKQQHA